jgi:hypothetical protein
MRLKNVLATRAGIVATGVLIGGIAVLLQCFGNPPNMGLCMACVTRDSSGALGLHRAELVQYLRPEILGIILGAMLMALGAREFKARDTNHDGVLTKAEVKAAIMKMGNGKKQIDAVHAQRLTDLWFGKADANKDGKVTEAEAQALLSRTFDEYEAARAAQAQQAGPKGR